ncbi:MAG: DNA polymerase IV [Crocinitomicaceae bacterium]|nr:DNA polymerase IV [Crocinitomicaceae bacterium]
MDAFYVSVEQLDNPELKGKPVVVGGNSRRGVIAAAGYEARKFGIRSAMPSAKAYRICPALIFVNPRFDRYKEVSSQIHEIFHRYTDEIEPLALDEAFLDVTYNKQEIKSATIIANQIREAIREEIGITCSAGISYSKFFAKIATEVKKPDGYFTITPEEGSEFVKELAIEKFFGVGQVTADKMKKLGIHFGKDLLSYSKPELSKLFGKSGPFYYDISRGIDNRPVKSNRIRKSIGAERTFSSNIIDKNTFDENLREITEMLWKRTLSVQKFGKTLTLKLKYEDFQTKTRSITKSFEIRTRRQLDKVVEEIKNQEDYLNNGIRLVGLQMSGFPEEKVNGQLTFEF